MKIVVNTRSGHLEMGLTYMKQIFGWLITNYPGHQFIFIADTGTLTWLPAAENVIIPNTGHVLDQPILIRWWHYYRLPSLLKKYGADLLINANGICCMRTSIPQFLLLGEETCLQFKKHKRHIAGSLTRKKSSRNNLAAYIQKAATIMVISAFAKSELERVFKTAENKIVVTGFPADERFKPLTWEEKNAVKEEFTNGKEYFLYQGTISPDQNIITLLKAFSLFKKRQLSNMQLLLTGNIHWPGTSFTEKIATYKFKNDVLVLPALSSAKMASISGAAYALVAPSSKPGFNVAQLHAITCGIPVIAAAPETEPGKEAVLPAHADKPEEIAEQMKLLYKDENLRNLVIAKGLSQKDDYTLPQVAGRIWNCISTTVAIPNLPLPT